MPDARGPLADGQVERQIRRASDKADKRAMIDYVRGWMDVSHLQNRCTSPSWAANKSFKAVSAFSAAECDFLGSGPP